MVKSKKCMEKMLVTRVLSLITVLLVTGISFSGVNLIIGWILLIAFKNLVKRLGLVERNKTRKSSINFSRSFMYLLNGSSFILATIWSINICMKTGLTQLPILAP